MRVVAVEAIPVQYEVLYDLTVEDTHTYLVGPSDVVVHNCGVGFEPVVGTLNGFTREAEIKVERSQRHLLEQKKGREKNSEAWATYEDGRREWRLTVGDSAEAWAKAVGKLLAQKKAFDVVVLDFSQIRPAGERLKGYGWISSGDETFAPAMKHIAEILNQRTGQLLTKMDILDIMNHLGTTLSSRRSAEIALMPAADVEAPAFAVAKKDFWLHNNEHRQQSNNSLVFDEKPAKQTIAALFEMMQAAGGSEPGMINRQHGRQRAPWMRGVNPCAEILLPNKGFCNLVEVDLTKFNGSYGQLLGAIELIARANYRQTCVNLDDGLLQRAWHENNEFLRLCGVGMTGIVGWEFADHPDKIEGIRAVAEQSAKVMAAELGLPLPKAVTTIKPSGTLSKIMDTTEGIHRPLGRYIFNNVRFSLHDPLVEKLAKAGYRVMRDPSSKDAALVTFPVEYKTVEFDEVEGKAVNNESAIAQLERYKLWMKHYVQHNCSITVNYSPEEVPEIVEWMHDNWDSFVGVSFIYRTDPSKAAADLGYLYLPQEVVGEVTFREYEKSLKRVRGLFSGAEELSKEAEDLEVSAGGECSTGACPIR